MNNDLISRSALEAKSKTIYMEFDNVAVPTRVISIADLHLAPTVDAEPVRHGEWIKMVFTDSGKHAGYKCSVCGLGAAKKFAYCHCGAKMDAEASE